MRKTLAREATTAPREDTGAPTRRQRRTAAAPPALPGARHQIPLYDLLSEEGLDLIDRTTDRILRDIGIDFRGDADARAVARGRRISLPLRCSGAFTSSKLPDARAMQESVTSLYTAILCGATFIPRAAGWLEAALAIGCEKLVPRASFPLSQDSDARSAAAAGAAHPASLADIFDMPRPPVRRRSYTDCENRKLVAEAVRYCLSHGYFATRKLDRMDIDCGCSLVAEALVPADVWERTSQESRIAQAESVKRDWNAYGKWERRRSEEYIRVAQIRDGNRPGGP